MAEDITLGEVVRRLDDISRRLDSVVDRVESRETAFEAKFLTRREFDLSSLTDATQVRGLEEELHKVVKRMEVTEERRRSDRALVFTALIAPILVALLTAAFLAQGTTP